MSRNSLFSPSRKLRSLLPGRRRGRLSRRDASVARRTARFEPLEARLALTANLGFAGAFSLIGAPPDDVFNTSSPIDTKGGGMITDAAGNRYVTVNGAFRVSSFGTNYSSLNVDLDPGPGVNATMMTAGLVKLDPNGGVLWTAPLKATGSGSPVVRVLAAVDASQNVYMVGDFRGTIDVDPGPGVVNVTSTANGTDFGYYMAKLNSAGQLQWVRTLAANELTPFRIAVDGAGNLIMASNFTFPDGPTDSTMDVDAGPGQSLMQTKNGYDLVVLKYSTDGNFVWARQFGDTGTDMFGDVPTLGVSSQGDVFACGGFKGTIDLDPGPGVYTVTNSDAKYDRFVVRLDPSGNFVWAYATEGVGGAAFRDIDVAPDGSVILGGFFSGTTDFQPGNGTLSLTSVGTHGNGLAVKLNGDSSVAWARQFGGLGQALALDTAVDQAGNIYLGGSFSYQPQAGETSDFDPGPGVYSLVAPSTNETAYVLSLTSAGDFRWAVPLGGNTGRSQVQGLSVTPNSDVQISGAFRGTGDFDPNPAAETWLTSSGSNQTVFTATLRQVTPDPGAPTVDAGQTQAILVTSSANLDGTVTDDGLPGPLTTTWSLQSGPGTATFGNASAIDTTATFSTIGNYLLKLQATDGQFTTADYVQIVVNPVTAKLTAAADTYVDGGSTTTNFGASTSLAVDGRPDDAVLLRWDMSVIPVGSTLQSATLSLNVVGSSADTYEIYELKRSWTELQSTWKKATSAINWQTAGADGPLDRGTAVLGAITASATGILNVALNAAGLAVVQGWVNSPATNFGFVVQDYNNKTDDDLIISSKESTVAANRPQLQVVYNPPSLAARSFNSASAAASTTSTSDTFASKLVQTKLVQPGSLTTTASQPQGASLLLDTAPSRRLSSAAADNALTDLGHEKNDPASWDDRLNDELLLDLASAQLLPRGL